MDNRFHLSLTVGLAVCLGAVATIALSPQDAIGYPAGPAVSAGHNPVVSAGGTTAWDSSSDLFTAPADHDIVITDIVLSGNTDSHRCKAQAWVKMDSASGTLGEFSVGTPVLYTNSWVASGGETNLVVDLASGLRLPAGETAQLSVSTEGMSYDCGSSSSYPNRVRVHYAVSGYLAQP
jgi:hypothetical protein